MTIETVNSREARRRWRDILDKVFTGNADVVIERNGKPVAVLISIEDYEDLQEELEDLRSTRRATDIYESWKRDQTTARSLEEVERDLRAEGLLDE